MKTLQLNETSIITGMNSYKMCNCDCCTEWGQHNCRNDRNIGQTDSIIECSNICRSFGWQILSCKPTK